MVAPSHDPSDLELRPALERGDPAAFAALYDRHAARLLRVAWGLLGDRAEAEDAVQDAFVSAVGARRSVARAESVERYLVAIVRHAALARRRARARRPIAVAAVPECHASAPGGTGVPDEALERALDALPVAQREVLVLKLDLGLTFAEAAALLGIGLDTAASRYRYALAKLRSALGVTP